MKTGELTGRRLVWAVAKCEGLIPATGSPREDEDALIFGGGLKSEVDWELAGPIIEREQIKVDPAYGDIWVATIDRRPAYEEHASEEGPTPLIAAMRAYVASKLGAEVEIPEELK